MGVPNSGGVKLFSVSGHVNNPGNFEVPLGTPFKKLLEMAGGVRNGHKLKAVIPGGSSMPVLPGEIMMDLNMDFDSIQKAGSYLGTGAVIVMDETTCMVKALERLSYFYFEESCGQCTPCREGTGWLYRIVHRIEKGEGRPRIWICCSACAKTLRAAPSARWVMPLRGRCRASSSIIVANLNITSSTNVAW